MANPNNGDNDGLIPFREPGPKQTEPSLLGLGQIAFIVDIETATVNINFTNPSTMQLSNPQELFGLVAMTHIRLLCEELKRRSKQVIIT